MKFGKAYQKIVWGVVIGAVLGYTYYHYIGCWSGTCPITSQPVNSTVYGAILGGLMVGAFRKPDDESGVEQKIK